MREKKEQKTPGAECVPPELVAQAKAGDQAAFTELYERTSTVIYRTIHSMVRDEDLVWDIQQDSYLRAWRSLDKLEANEAFLPWLRRIAVNAAAAALSKRVPLTFTDLAGDEEDREPEIPDLNPDVQPELALDRKETSRLVREILGSLSPEQQAVVGMFYYEDMPVKDIAALLRISPSTVKNQLFRGRKKVEAGVRALEKQGVKLYGLSPLPFLLALLGRLEPAAGAEKKVLSAVLAEAPAATAAAGAAGSSAVTVTALTAGQAFLKGLGAKLVAGVLAVAMIAVGGKLAYDALTERKVPPIGIERPTAEETVSPSELVAPTKLYAPDDAPENACGPNLTWRFDETTGTLIIEGSGRMYDYSYDNNAMSPPPWNSVSELMTSAALPNELSSIGSAAFCFCSKLTSVTIPESVTTIGDSAFICCISLTSVTIPESVTTIGDYAFSCCELTSVTIPESVIAIGNCAFDGCSSLTSVTIPESVTTIGDYAFQNCSGLTSVTIPESVASIGESAFSGCTGLTSVTIPESVTYIGEDTFEGCTGLTSVTIPKGVTTIEKGAFQNCTGLTSVTISEGVTSIGDWAFFGCTGLTSVTIPRSVTSIGEGALSACKSLESISVHPASESFLTDGIGALYNKERTTIIAFPGGKGGTYTILNSVTTIRASAFYGCTKLTSVTIPESVTTIGDSAFNWCVSLTSVTIPESVTTIGDSAFSYCEGLTSVTIPESVTSIGESTFIGCSGLTSVTIPESVTSIGSWAFCNCYGLVSITIPEGATSIANNTFRGCSGLMSVTIPEGVTSIGSEAFLNCSGLVSITIPESVTSIGDSTFENCTSLTSVTIPKRVTTIGSWAFCNCSGLTSMMIPEGVTSIGDSAFSGCTGLTSVTIPENVTSIGNSAFYGCDNLTIRGTAGSEAERYADENGIPFEALSEALYRDVLAEAHTTFPAIQDRTNNLKQACAAIDGTVLMPGETFSFNGVVGQPTEEKGYLPAADSVSGGESMPEVGGGVSQVASSIYYAVLQADLATVERSPHTYPVDYVPMGMDAAVSWGSQDFQFRNSSPYPVKLEASVSGEMVHIVLRGTEWKDYSVSLSYEILERIEWETVEKEVPNDGTCQNGEVLTTPLTGYKVVTYRTAQSIETGSKLETTEIAVSRYEKRDKVIAKVVGT